MPQGTIVIANDLLGVVEYIENDICGIKDKEGTLHTVKKNVCVEVCRPYALRYLIMRKMNDAYRRNKVQSTH